MVNGELLFLADPGDLAFQHRDTRFQFRYGERIEILPDDRIQQIVEAGAGFVGVHEGNR